MSSEIPQEFDLEKIQFNEAGLVPAIAQDYKDGAVLMLAYMNRESILKSLELGQAVYYSRSRKELWHKGATSGHYQNIKLIHIDCDFDTILLKVEQVGDIACHTGARSCFFNEVKI